MKKVFGILFFILLLAAAFGYWKYFYTYSDGYRTGLLQKFSHKGNIFKTYEGELVLSSISSGNGVALASEKFFFSVADTKVAHELQQMEGRNVRLHYTQKNGALIWRGESDYIVDGIEAVNPNGQAQPISAQPSTPANTTAPATPVQATPAQNQVAAPAPAASNPATSAPVNNVTSPEQVVAQPTQAVPTAQ